MHNDSYQTWLSTKGLSELTLSEEISFNLHVDDATHTYMCYIHMNNVYTKLFFKIYTIH